MAIGVVTDFDADESKGDKNYFIFYYVHLILSFRLIRAPNRLQPVPELYLSGSLTRSE